MDSIRVFFRVLVIIFLVEAGVMCLLPMLMPPGLDANLEALVDSSTLILISAPLLWWVVIRPLRMIAMTERAKAASIVESAADGIITIDEHGIVQSFNTAAERILGYTADEIIGANTTVMMPERLVAQHREAFRRYLKTGESHLLGGTVRVVGRRKDGSEVPLALSVSAVHVEGHHLFTGILRDLTEHERLESERKRRSRQQAAVAELGRRALACEDLAVLLDETAVCVSSMLDVEYCLIGEFLSDSSTLLLQAGTGWNEGLVGERMLNLKTDLASGGDVLSDVPQSVEEYSSENCSGGSSLLHDHHVASGMSVVIRGSDRPFGLLGAYTTEPRSFSKDDAHFLQDVAIEITLAVQRKQAEIQRQEREVSRAKQMAVVAQIATGVAHEIRNPLTAVKMLVQTCREKGAANSLEGEDLQIIEDEIRRMERCVNTFLDFARPSKPTRSRLDLSALVERTFALSQPRASQQHVALEFTPPQTPAIVEADWEQIQQLLLNLVFNAIDAMPHGGELTVDLRDAVEGQVELRVLDSGPGISPEVLPRLFQPFVTNKVTGVGLGLVVSRRIAEDHGGALSAHNQPDGGACFVLRLPVAP